MYMEITNVHMMHLVMNIIHNPFMNVLIVGVKDHALESVNYVQ